MPTADVEVFDPTCWPLGVPLIFLGLTPCFTMLLCITYFHNVVAALLVMHWGCMALFPLLYIRMTHQTRYYSLLFRYQASKWREQLILAGPTFIGTFLISFTSYLFLRCKHSILPICVPLETEIIKAEGLDYGIGLASAIGAYFTFVNPIFEEFFWRNFIYRELGGRVLPGRDAEFAPLLKDSHTASYSGGGASTTAPASGGGVDLDSRDRGDEPAHVELMEEGLQHDFASDSFPDVYVGELGKWLVSSYYASYHVVIVYHLCNALIASLAFMFLVLFGRLMIYTRNHLRLGLLNAYWIHAGLDMAVVAAIGNVVYFKVV